MKHLAIKNGTIIDGKGAPPYQGDLVLVEEKIAEVGHDLDLPAQMPSIDVSGSMQQRDIQPSRLQRAKQKLSDLIALRKREARP